MISAVGKYDSKLFTYGAEHEWADWPIDAELPRGCAHNKKDHTVANSNGIANDPRGRVYKFGGEINARPTRSIEEQVAVLRALHSALPQARVNYRSNLHVHVRAPGLADDLGALLRVQRYIHAYMPAALDIIVPLPRPTAFQHRSREVLEGATRRWRRCLVSHRTLLPPARLRRQLAAQTRREFFEAEVPRSRDRPLWHLQPRACVNMRQLLETDTVEFRHFPGTLDPGEFRACLTWCKKFLCAALAGAPAEPLLAWARSQKFPQFPPYDHAIDVRFRATVHDGSVPPAEIEKNIRAILDGTFEAEAA